MKNLKCLFGFHGLEIYYGNEEKTSFVYICPRCGHQPPMVSHDVKVRPYSELQELLKK